MARSATVKHIRKSGEFVGTQLAAGEVGVNLSAGLMFSTDGADAIRVGNTVFIIHGGTAGTARPAGGTLILVIWLGTVTPTNMATNDLFINTT